MTTPTLFLGVDRLERMEEIEAQFIPRLRERTAAEWFAEGLRRKIPIVPVPSVDDLINDAEKKARGAIVPVRIGHESGFTAGSMQRLTGTPPRAWRRGACDRRSAAADRGARKTVPLALRPVRPAVCRLKASA